MKIFRREDKIIIPIALIALLVVWLIDGPGIATVFLCGLLVGFMVRVIEIYIRGWKTSDD